MLQELIGKRVQIQVNWWTSIEGEVIAVDEIWVKLKSKKSMELVKIVEIFNISTSI
jgi:small nuclear ribonucleoprotein (snRNP)-like protein